MNISQFTHYQHLVNFMLTLENSENLPFYAYSNDLEGKFLNCNEKQAYDFGFNKKEDLIGLTLLDIKSVFRECLEQFQKNDQKVVAMKKPKVFAEPINYVNNSKGIAISQKAPLFNSKNEVIGSMGCSLIIEKNDIAENFFPLLSFANPNDYNLTKKEMEIVHQIVKGQTAKQIAKLIGISYRTVEQYTENIKIKLGVTKKQEIICKMISLFEA